MSAHPAEGKGRIRVNFLQIM